MNELDTLDVKEAAVYLKCHENTVRSKASAGEIPALKFGNKYVFLRGELARLFRIAAKKLEDESGERSCQLKNEKVRLISTTVSGTRAASTVLAQARKSAKMRNK
ncbi:MAG: hypothetical protein COA86_02630 [Kangiella sp.]|nr:MAG: hypothetical protein COA86_02630 [Kangiella sp.]